MFCDCVPQTFTAYQIQLCELRSKKSCFFSVINDKLSALAHLKHDRKVYVQFYHRLTLKLT